MAELEFGCTKLTVSLWPTLNERQSIAARCVPCVTVVVAPFCWIAAWPAVTVPPCGAAKASGMASMAVAATPGRNMREISSASGRAVKSA